MVTIEKPKANRIQPKKAIAHLLGTLAEQALLEEVYTTPKPGLVDRISNGAHKDMSLDTFLASAKAITPFFIQMAEVGYDYYDHPQYCFLAIRKIGIEAEKAMFDATNGVNTHKGLIFSIGILCTAAAAVYRKKGMLTYNDWIMMEQQMVSDILKEEMRHLQKSEIAQSHGERVYHTYGARGIRGEALSGYASVMELSLPVMQEGMRAGYAFNLVKLQTLFVLMSHVEDSNILSRRDPKMLQRVQKLAKTFIKSGGAYREDAVSILQELDIIFTKENISAGGCADLLAVTIFLYHVNKIFTL